MTPAPGLRAGNDSRLAASDAIDGAGSARSRRPRRARPFHLTERDLRVLEMVAVHRFVLAPHVQSWLGCSAQVAYRRLSGLVGVGLLRCARIFHAQPGCYVISNGGLAVIDSDLPRPTIDLRTYGHDIGVVSLWLSAAAGRFGLVESVLSERQMRSRDQRPDPPPDVRFGVPVEGYDRAGRPRVHYPDAMLLKAGDRRLALELELSVKSRRRLERILIGYAGEPRIERVVYVVVAGAVARTLNAMVRELALGELIEVRRLPTPKLLGSGPCFGDGGLL